MCGLRLKCRFSVFKIWKSSLFSAIQGKMSISGPCIFKSDLKRRDFFIHSSVYIVRNFAKKNKELPSIMFCLPLSWFLSVILVFFNFRFKIYKVCSLSFPFFRFRNNSNWSRSREIQTVDLCVSKQLKHTGKNSWCF